MFPPCFLTRSQTMVELMKIMVTSFKRSHVCTATLSAPNPAAGHSLPIPLLETPAHSWASRVSLLWRYGSAVACRIRRGSGCSRPGCGISLLEEVTFNQPQSCQTLHKTGKQTLGGHKQNLVHQDPGGRFSDPTRTDSDRPV